MGDEKNELICETSDVVLCMATDGERIIYGTDDNKLWEYDIRAKSLDCKNETLRVWQAARQGTVLLPYLIFRCLVWLVFFWPTLYIARGK